jgi:hypothetical protein
VLRIEKNHAIENSSAPAAQRIAQLKILYKPKWTKGGEEFILGVFICEAFGHE